jgi:hypothetical protein
VPADEAERTESASTQTSFLDSEDFQTRCAQPRVVRCVGFDTAADIPNGSGGPSGAWGYNAGVLPPHGTSDYTRATLDTTFKASGGGSLKFTIPPHSGADTSGAYFTNFSQDLSVQFGENSEFFVQWRQRFSPEFVSTRYAGGGGWKQLIIGTGDKPGITARSCTPLEVVVQNNYHQGFPIVYNSCTGSATHGPYDPFGERGRYLGYAANEWMTFQVRIKTGPRVGDEFRKSHVTMWMAREGKRSRKVLDFGPYNLSAGNAAENQQYGKVWLLPYNTGKDPSVSHRTAYTWYDELVISRARIADPPVASRRPLQSLPAD